jgi:hypothetical protein
MVGYLNSGKRYFESLNDKPMFRKIKQVFNQYREYVRVDLVMYGVLILLIFIYAILTALEVI